MHLTSNMLYVCVSAASVHGGTEGRKPEPVPAGQPGGTSGLRSQCNDNIPYLYTIKPGRTSGIRSQCNGNIPYMYTILPGRTSGVRSQCNGLSIYNCP